MHISLRNCQKYHLIRKTSFRKILYVIHFQDNAKTLYMQYVYMSMYYVLCMIMYYVHVDIQCYKNVERIILVVKVGEERRENKE